MQISVSTVVGVLASLSARRAWIEMRLSDMSDAWHRVALRKESVDRNQVAVHFDTLSAVALRKESVDRNSPAMNTISYTTGRSPQGERG